MAFPIAAAIGAGTSLIGGFLGAKSDAAANKRAKEQLKVDKALADRQIQISKYIEEIARGTMNVSGDYTDIYGGGVRFNPVTNKFESSMGDIPRGLQSASDAEERQRLTVDQVIRNRGLQDFENMRQRSVGEADRSLDRINNFRKGIGRVDPERVGSQLRADRTRAVNAGFDDAERAASTLQLRTGSSAVGDALANLGRDRVRAQAEIGSPELEGQQYAEGMNAQRLQQMFGEYKGFGDEGRGFYDAAFTPANRDAEQYQKFADALKFDLSKRDLAMGGSGSAASTIGQAAAGLRAGYNASEANRVRSPWGQFIAAAGNQAATLFPKPGGG